MKQTSGITIKELTIKEDVYKVSIMAEWHMVFCNRGKRFLWEIKGINIYYI